MIAQEVPAGSGGRLAAERGTLRLVHAFMARLSLDVEEYEDTADPIAACLEILYQEYGWAIIP